MRTQQIGRSSLVCTRINYGNMRCVGGWDPAKVTPELEANGCACMRAAFECGITHFDTADIYCRGVCEKVLGDTLREVRGMRDRILITTKVGIRFDDEPFPGAPHRYDFSAEHITTSCDRSLKRMGIETIDLYLLHRPDMLMDPPEIAGAFEKLQAAGKVRFFGVSNFKPSLVNMLQKYLPMPLVCNQVCVHPGRLDVMYDGTFDQCIEQNITPQSWSPIGGGLFGEGGVPKADNPRRDGLLKLLGIMDEIAREHGVKRELIALAWLLRHPAKIMPVLGTAKVDRIKEQVKADSIELTREQWYRIFVAARMKRLP
jgi:predicted oxidoreductase